MPANKQYHLRNINFLNAETLTCTKCFIEQPNNQFYKSVNANGIGIRIARQCKTCIKLNINNKHLLQHYGITKEEYQQMLDNQSNTCSVCLNQFISLSNVQDGQSPVIDHCHLTGQIRGIIHRTCNILLGLAKDNPALLRQAAIYLESNKKVM